MGARTLIASLVCTPMPCHRSTAIRLLMGLAALAGLSAHDAGAQMLKRELFISFDGCAQAGPSVGDTLQLTAAVRRPAGSPASIWSSPAIDLVTSSGAWYLFRWSVEPPTSPSWNPPGRAKISRRGQLIARAPGMIIVTARALGVDDARPIQILPRVMRFALTPRDTTIHTGDTVVVRAEAQFDTLVESDPFQWELPRQPPTPHRVLTELTLAHSVQGKPSTTYWYERRSIALLPGDVTYKVCLGNSRLQTATLHIVGPPLVGDNLPPRVALSPDTTVYIGDSFGTALSVNEAGANPRSNWWHTQFDFGDGKTADGRDTNFTSRHVYTTEGAHKIVVTVTDTLGRSSVASRTVTASRYPCR